MRVTDFSGTKYWLITHFFFLKKDCYYQIIATAALQNKTKKLYTHELYLIHYSYSFYVSPRVLLNYNPGVCMAMLFFLSPFEP